MFSGDTNADEMNVATNIQRNAMEFTASADPATRPVYAWIQLNAYANRNSSNVATAASASEPSNRNPMMNATPSITANEIALRTTSLIVRPIRYADGYIGSERNRSMNPLLRSSAIPRPV